MLLLVLLGSAWCVFVGSSLPCTPVLLLLLIAACCVHLALLLCEPDVLAARRPPPSLSSPASILPRSCLHPASTSLHPTSLLPSLSYPVCESVCACVSQEKESDSESESEVVEADEEDSDFSPEDAADGQEQQVCGWLGGLGGSPLMHACAHVVAKA
jgi:hypothetical protein